MKPIIRRAVRQVGLWPHPLGWICQTHHLDNRGWDNFNERYLTWSSTPAEAFRKWFEGTRKNAAGMIDEVLITPPMRMLRCSVLARKTLGLIEHDRYLLKLDSRQPGGKAQP